MHRTLFVIIVAAACGRPSEAPPLGPRPEPIAPATNLPHIPRPSHPTTDGALTTSVNSGELLGFPADHPRAEALAEQRIDAGTDAILPPEVPLPDAGLLPDGGNPMVR
jgi:hypothetical protein